MHGLCKLVTLVVLHGALQEPGKEVLTRLIPRGALCPLFQRVNATAVQQTRFYLRGIIHCFTLAATSASVDTIAALYTGWALRLLGPVFHGR